MAERSKRIELFNSDLIVKINSETLKLFQKYRIDMELRELSENTIYQYESDLNQWFIYIYENQGNQCVTELDEDDLTEFFYYCKKAGNNSRRMKRRMSSISAFYKYLRKKKVVIENPMEFIDRPQKDVDVVTQTFLTKEQVDLMRTKLFEYEGTRAKEIRLYALLSLSTMARVNAISHIRWEQIDYEERMINDVLEKEGKIVTLYFSEEVKELLLDLKEDRKENDGGWVFNYGTEPISNGSLGDWCKLIGNMIGVPTLHPHDFRHSGAQLYKLAGMPLEDISTLLHHNDVGTTKKFYLRDDKKAIQKQKDKFNF